MASRAKTQTELWREWIEEEMRGIAEGSCRKYKWKTPLTCAAQYDFHDLIPTLLEAGADVNSYGDFKGPVLFDAVMYNSLNAAAVLLKHGASVNKSNFYGDTPLSLARRYFNHKMEALLIAHGAV